jgi:MraZ protein
LRAFAEIEREAVVIGVNTYLELWNPARWEAANALIYSDGAEIAQRLASLI